MQGAKDSFYTALRDRLSALNPERTAVVDGVERPAIVVEENESAGLSPLDGTFRVQWGGCTSVGGGSRLMKMDCTVRYSAVGIDGSNGDRGRMLTSMDADLLSISQPMRTMKMDYSVIPTKSAGTMVFWTDLEFNDPKDQAGRIEREAKTTVYFFGSTTEAQG